MEKLQPKLRFPEFVKDWSNEDIHSILKIGSGRDYKHLNYGNIPVFGTGGLMTYVNDFLYNGETVCIGRKGTIDKPMYYNGPIWTVDTLFYTHSFKNTLPKFIYFCFLNINWKEYNEASGVPSLSKSTIERIIISFPSLPEQQKIASFLTTVDDKISNLKQKVSLLEKYKKGVMQQIFSQQIRFKDTSGNDYPDWEEKSLGEIGKFYVGGDLDKLEYKKEYSEDFVYPIYANGAGEGLYGYAKNFQYLEGCVTVSGRGNLGLAKYRKNKFNAIVRLIVIQPNENTHPKFLEEYINNIRFIVESTGVPQLTVPQISKYKIIQPQIKEQTKIAEFLSGIDNKIETTKLQLSKMEVWKKGLLQGIFC